MTDSQSQAIPQDEFLTIYREMRRIAAIHLRRSPSHPTLQPTMIVHEAYLRLSGYPWKSRTHYLALASRAMRQWIIDYLRAKMALLREIVPAPDFVETTFEDGYVQTSSEPKRGRHVVGGIA